MRQVAPVRADSEELAKFKENQHYHGDFYCSVCIRAACRPANGDLWFFTTLIVEVGPGTIARANEIIATISKRGIIEEPLAHGMPASYHVCSAVCLQRGFQVLAFLSSSGTSWMKSAAGRWIGWAGHFAG